MKHLIKIESTPHGVLGVRHAGLDKQYCEAGEIVILEWQPDAKWGLQEAHYTDKDGNVTPIDLTPVKVNGKDVVVFTMPDDNITVDGTFKRFVLEDWTGDSAESPIFNEHIDATDQQRNTALANVSNQTANSTTGKMGYKVLDPTKTFAEQVTTENTIYEIRDVFEISTDISIPENTTLYFNGGKLVGNGTSTFSNTKLEGGPKILCGVAGNIKESDITWFMEDSNDDIGVIVNKIQSISDKIIIPEGNFYIQTPAIISKSNSLVEWHGDVVYNGITTDIEIFTIRNAHPFNMDGSLTNESTAVNYTNANLTNQTGISFLNVQNSTIKVNKVVGFNVNIMVKGDNAGCAYNQFYFNFIYHANIGLLITQDNGGWSNENIFIGGRFGIYPSSWELSTSEAHSIVCRSGGSSDSYNTVNGLIFMKQSLEGASAYIPVVLNNTSDSKFIDYRDENVSTFAKLIGSCSNLNFSTQNKHGDIDLSECTTSLRYVFGNQFTRTTYNWHIDDLTEGLKYESRYYPYGKFMPISNTGSNEYYCTYTSSQNTVSKIGVEIKLNVNTTNVLYFVCNRDSSSVASSIYVKLMKDKNGDSITDPTIYHVFGSGISYNTGKYFGTSYKEGFIVIPSDISVIRIAFYYVSDFSIDIPSNAFLSCRTNIPNIGTTSQRPNTAFCWKGFKYYDTDLGKYICYNGTSWVNLDGTALS